MPVALPFLQVALVPYLLAVFGMLAASTTPGFQAAYRGDPESGTVARGFLIPMACLGADILKELKALPVPAGLPILGFTVLFLAAARTLHDRFDRGEQASRTDPLTGLGNRRGFLEACDECRKSQRRSGKPISVILAHRDHLKQVNDALGYAAGENVLEQIARALVGHLREQHTVGRWGGEELVLCGGRRRLRKSL